MTSALGPRHTVSRHVPQGRVREGEETREGAPGAVFTQVVGFSSLPPNLQDVGTGTDPSPSDAA